MDTDVFASYLTATGSAVGRRARVKSVFLTGTGTAIFTDGGAGGTSRLTLNAAASTSVIIPDGGILFSTDVYITIAGLTAITVFYA